MYQIVLTKVLFSKSTLKIFDITGRLVKDFSRQLSVIGHQSSVVWDGTDLNGRRVANGVYFINLDVAGEKLSTKVVMLR